MATPEQQANTAVYPNISSVEPSTSPGSAPTANGSVLAQAQASVQSAAQAVRNSETAQSISNGPVATNVKEQTAKTSNEFQNLANARATPSTPAATGQPLTHYHSMFYSLLSWENPRASAVSYVCTILFIFAARYFNIIKYILKLSYIVLGTTAALEIAGKFIFDYGLASKIRPKRYYTIPREALEASLEDVEQLLNFFVIESQRVLFAENVTITLGVFIALLIAYGLIKLLPLWGLALVATTCIYMLPLVYVSNREAIDGLVNEASDMVNAQAVQIRDVTAQRADQASKQFKNYAGEYSSRAQGYMRGSSPAAQSNGSATNSSISSMPSVPKQEPISTASAPIPSVEQPVIAH